MEKLTLVTVRNAFNRADRETAVIDYDLRRSLLELRQEHFPKDITAHVSLNGVIIRADELALTFPSPSDCVLFVPSIEGGGGGGGKMVLRALAMIAVAIAAPYLAGPAMLGLTAGSLGFYAATAAIMMVGGLLVNTLLPPVSKTNTGQDADTSISYGWNPGTTQQQGVCVPKHYGTTRLYGNIITAYIESATESKQYINTLISLGLGPVSRLYDFKINDQPVDSFQGVTIDTRLGNMDQDVIPNFNDTKTEFPLSVKVVKDSPYTYTTVDDDFDGLEVEVSWPEGLWHTTSDGDFAIHRCDFRVSIRLSGGTWYPISYSPDTTASRSYGGKWSAGFWVEGLYIEDSIYAPKSYGTYWYELSLGTTDPAAHYDGEPYSSATYPHINCVWRWIAAASERIATAVLDHTEVREKKVSVVKRMFKAITATHGVYQIKVENLSVDRTGIRYGDDLYFTTVREVYADDFQYPRHALVGIRALATDQLSGSLRFSCLCDASLIRVYDSDEETWSVEFNSNPAWVCWDILTQPVFENDLDVIRYDGVDPSRLDLVKFAEWAAFCDTLVSDGDGGTEPRCTWNGGFDAESDMWRCALQVCQVGRAVLVWNGIKLTVAIDSTATPVQLFSVGNIGIDSFKEDFLALEDRAAEIEIDFMNAEKDYERDKLRVVNDGVANTVNKVSLQLFGITKASEGWRAGMLRLYKNQYVTRIVEFEADIDAIACTIGDCINVQHDVPQWGYGGRIVSATTNTVTLDHTVPIDTAKSYGIMVRLANDTIVEKNIVNPGTGEFSTFTVTTVFASTPVKFDIYAFGELTKIVKPFRVTDLSKSGDQKVTISAVEYNASIYNVDTGDPVLPTPDYSALDPLPPVTGITAKEIIVHMQDGTAVNQIILNFIKPLSDMYKMAQIWYVDGEDGIWKKAGETKEDYFIIGRGGLGGSDWGMFPWGYSGWGLETYLTHTIAVLTVNKLEAVMLLQNAPTVDLEPAGDTTVPSSLTEAPAGTCKYKSWQFTWADSVETFVKSYHVQIATDTGFTAIVWEAWVGSNEATFTDNTQDYGTLYCRVKPRSSSGVESADWSPTGSAETEPTQTVDVEDDAITSSGSAYTAGNTSSITNTETSIQSYTITTVGGNVELHFSFTWDGISFSSGAVMALLMFKIYRDSTEIKAGQIGELNDTTDDILFRNDLISSSALDVAPAAGEYTYYLKIYTTSANVSFIAKQRMLSVKELKK